MLRDQLGETLLRRIRRRSRRAIDRRTANREIEERRAAAKTAWPAPQRKMRTHRPVAGARAGQAAPPSPPRPAQTCLRLARARGCERAQRQRIERATTEDRKGRTIAVERHVLAKPTKKKSRFAEKFYSPAKGRWRAETPSGRRHWSSTKARTPGATRKGFRETPGTACGRAPAAQPGAAPREERDEATGMVCRKSARSVLPGSARNGMERSGRKGASRNAPNGLRESARSAAPRSVLRGARRSDRNGLPKTRGASCREAPGTEWSGATGKELRETPRTACGKAPGARPRAAS